MAVTPLDYHRAIFDDRELTSSQRLVALAICRHAGADGQRSHPGNELLCQETGYSLNTVKASLKTLREKGWIVQTYNGRGGNQSKASEYDLAIPKVNDCPLADDAQGAMVDAQRAMVDSQRATIGTTDAFLNAPVNRSKGKKRSVITEEHLGLDVSLVPQKKASPGSQDVPAITTKEEEVIEQADIDYRDIAKKGFKEALGDDIGLSLEVLGNLQKHWPDASGIPFDHLVSGCFSWKQYNLWAEGTTAEELGVQSVPAIVAWHLKNDNLINLAANGKAHILRYDEENSGYDPRHCDIDVTYDIQPDYDWAA